MAGEENKWAGDCYRRGVDAMNKKNWDLAVEMFSTCVKLVPGNLVYRQLLRQNAKKKYGDNGKGAGTFEKTKLMGIRSRIKKAKAGSEWEDVSKAAEEGLYLNPWDTQLNIELAEASIQLDRGDIARLSYKEACESSPKDKALWLTFVEFLRTRKEHDEALKILVMLQKLDAKDLNLGRLITQIQTEKTTHQGKYEDAESTRDVIFGGNAAAAAGKRGDTLAPGQSVENDLRHAIRRDPNQIDNYLKLASHLKSVKKFDEAYEVMKQAVELSGNDAGIREQMEDAELLVLKTQADAAREKANTTQNVDDRKHAAGLANAMRDRRIEVLKARVDRYPANMGIKLDLAQLLMQLQQWSQAIPLLQKSSQDPRLKTKSFVSLGKCFMYDKKLTLSRGQFERAVPDLNPDQDPDTFKECHYLLARVCEELKDIPAAEKHYGDVLVLDYDYKDARERLEKIQAG